MIQLLLLSIIVIVLSYVLVTTTKDDCYDKLLANCHIQYDNKFNWAVYRHGQLIFCNGQMITPAMLMQCGLSRKEAKFFADYATEDDFDLQFCRVIKVSHKAELVTSL